MIATKPVKSPYLFPVYSTCLWLQTLAITHSISSDFYYSSKSSPTLVFNSIKACRGEPWNHKIELHHLLTTKCIWNNFYVCINLLSFQCSIKSITTTHPTHHIHFFNDLLLESCIWSVFICVSYATSVLVASTKEIREARVNKLSTLDQCNVDDKLVVNKVICIATFMPRDRWKPHNSCCSPPVCHQHSCVDSLFTRASLASIISITSEHSTVLPPSNTLSFSHFHRQVTIWWWKMLTSCTPQLTVTLHFCVVCPTPWHA